MRPQVDVLTERKLGVVGTCRGMHAAYSSMFPDLTLLSLQGLQTVRSFFWRAAPPALAPVLTSSSSCAADPVAVARPGLGALFPLPFGLAPCEPAVLRVFAVFDGLAAALSRSLLLHKGKTQKRRVIVYEARRIVCRHCCSPFHTMLRDCFRGQNRATSNLRNKTKKTTTTTGVLIYIHAPDLADQNDLNLTVRFFDLKKSESNNRNRTR